MNWVRVCHGICSERERENTAYVQRVVEVEPMQPKGQWAPLKGVCNRQKWFVNNEGKNEKFYELIQYINRNSIHKGNKNNNLGNLSRKLKEKEERKMKGEVRLRKERKVITAKTT